MCHLKQRKVVVSVRWANSHADMKIIWNWCYMFCCKLLWSVIRFWPSLKSLCRKTQRFFDMLHTFVCRLFPSPSLTHWGRDKMAADFLTFSVAVLRMKLQWNPSGKARNVSLKLQNLVHFHAPFFTNHVYFTPHDRPPLLKGHHFRWPL